MTVTTRNFPYTQQTANTLVRPSISKFIGATPSRSKEKEDDSEIPTKFLLDSLRQSEKDYKAGRYKSFNTGQDALTYLDEIIHGKKN